MYKVPYKIVIQAWNGSEETKRKACLPKQNPSSPKKNEEPSANCDVKNSVLQI